MTHDCEKNLEWVDWATSFVSGYWRCRICGAIKYQFIKVVKNIEQKNELFINI